jgi:hypothetical protein
MHCGKNLLGAILQNEVHYYDDNPNVQSVYGDNNMVPFPYGGFNIEAMDSHGEWVASASDLSKFLYAIGPYCVSPHILKKSTIDTMLTAPSFNPYYALGWMIAPNVHNWWHNGNLPGTTSEIVCGKIDNNSGHPITFVFLFNKRKQVGNDNLIQIKADTILWSVLGAVNRKGDWPANDLWK